MLISKNKFPQAAAQTEVLTESGEGTGGKAVRTSPHCLSKSEFAGACAERVEKSRRVRVCAAAAGCRAGTARVLFFCERFLLHTKRKCSRITMNFIFNSQWRTAFVRKNTKPRRAIHESPAKKIPTANRRTNPHKPQRKRRNFLRAARGLAAKPTAQARTV